MKNDESVIELNNVLLRDFPDQMQELVNAGFQFTGYGSDELGVVYRTTIVLSAERGNRVIARTTDIDVRITDLRSRNIDYKIGFTYGVALAANTEMQIVEFQAPGIDSVNVNGAIRRIARFFEILMDY